MELFSIYYYDNNEEECMEVVASTGYPTNAEAFKYLLDNSLVLEDDDPEQVITDIMRCYITDLNNKKVTVEVSYEAN